MCFNDKKHKQIIYYKICELQIAVCILNAYMVCVQTGLKYSIHMFKGKQTMPIAAARYPADKGYPYPISILKHIFNNTNKNIIFKNLLTFFSNSQQI